MLLLLLDVELLSLAKYYSEHATQAAPCIWEPNPAPVEGAYRVRSLQEEASAVVEENGARHIPPATSLAATTTGEE